MILKPLSRFGTSAGAFLLCLPVFILLTYVGMIVYLRTGQFTTVRPMGGVALGLCLLLERRHLVPLLLAAAVGSVGIKLAEGYGALDAAISSAMTISVVLAIYALRHSIFRLDFRNWRHLAGFMALAGLLSALSGLAYGEMMHLLGSSLSWMDRGQWTLTTALSFCVFTPVTVLLGSIQSQALRHRGWRLAAAMAVLAMVLSVVCLVRLPAPTLFAVPLALAWVVMMAEIEGAVAGLLLTEIMFVATITLKSGLAAFSPSYAPGSQLFVSQIVIVIMTLVILPLAVAVNERQALRARLHDAADEARTNAALLEGIINSARDHAIYMLDPDGNVMTWNSGAEFNKGYKAEEVIGTNYARFFPPEAVKAGLPAQELAAAAAKSSFHDQGWRRRKDGTDFWADVSLTAIRDGEGKLRGFAKVTRDISEQKQYVDRLAIAKEAAEKLSEAKSEFLANMSHEIRTPLTSVVGFADLLAEQPELGAASRRYSDQVRNGAHLLISLVSDILDYSKLETGQLKLMPAPMRVGDVLADTVQLLSVQAQKKGLALEIAPSAELDMTVVLDRDRLGQILINLVGNAIKFTDHGSVTLAVECPASRGTLRFSVRDTGIGIAPSQLGNLFQRFTQLEEGPARRHRGSGLGLAICKSLTEAMGGVIAVNSQAGKGSTFWFEIPVLADGNDQQAPEMDHVA